MASTQCRYGPGIDAGDGDGDTGNPLCVQELSSALPLSEESGNPTHPEIGGLPAYPTFCQSENQVCFRATQLEPGIDLSPTPQNLISCSLVNSGPAKLCVYKTPDEGALQDSPRCQDSDQTEQLHGCGTAKACPLWGEMDAACVSPLKEESESEKFEESTLGMRGEEEIQPKLAPDAFQKEVDEASDAATYESDSHHGRKSIGASDRRLASFAENAFINGSSYYIFDAESANRGYYVYRTLDSMGGEKYSSRSVPVRFCPQDVGGPAYRIGMVTATSHQWGEDVKGNRSGSDIAHAGQDSSSCQTPSEVLRTSYNAFRFDSQQNETARQEKLQTRVHSGQFNLAVSLILSRARDMLRARQLRRPAPHSRNFMDINNYSGFSWLSDEDIREVIKLTIEESQRLEKDAVEVMQTRTQNDSHASYSPSMPTLDRNTIEPCSPVAVDPATTISIPKTSYASVTLRNAHIHTKTRGDDRSTTATIVSKRSVAEITWTENDHGQDQPRSRNSSGSLSNSASTTGSWTQFWSTPHAPFGIHACERGADIARCSLHHYARPSPLDSRKPSMDLSKSQSSNMENLSNITSFPELRPRHCTREWQTPPVELDQINASLSDLYNQGVDAHCGGPLRPETVHADAGDTAKQTNAYDFASFDDGAFLPGNETWWKRRSTDPSASLPPDKRLGKSIGSSSHRRRHSQVTDSRSTSVESQESLLPNFMSKLRRGSQKILGNTQPIDFNGVEDSVPQSSPAPGHALRAKISDRNDGPPNEWGIYEAMTGSRLVVRKRHDTCSEDNRPHICENDGDLPAMKPAVGTSKSPEIA